MIVQKIDLIQKYWVNFQNLQIKTFIGPFFSPKNLTHKCSWSVLLLYMRAIGHCYVSRSFLQILASGECKKWWVSQNLRLGFHISKLESSKARVLLGFCLVPQRSLTLPDNVYLGKSKGLFALGYKLINNNFFKDRSFWRNLVLHMHILINNPVRVTLTKKVTFWGKIKCTANFSVYVLLFGD